MIVAQVSRSEEAIALVAILGVVGLPLIWVVAHYVYYGIKQWQATTLVREMVARGYKAQEIIEICQALGNKPKQLPDPKLLDVPPAKPIKEPAYSP
jgi:hypothetical protein